MWLSDSYDLAKLCELGSIPASCTSFSLCAVCRWCWRPPTQHQFCRVNPDLSQCSGRVRIPLQGKRIWPNRASARLCLCQFTKLNRIQKPNLLAEVGRSQMIQVAGQSAGCTVQLDRVDLYLQGPCHRAADQTQYTPNTSVSPRTCTA